MWTLSCEVFIKFAVTHRYVITHWVFSISAEKVLDQMEYKFSLTAYNLIPASVSDIM